MSDSDDTDRAQILWPFLDMHEHYGDDELARYIMHCGVDIDAAPDLDDAVAAHYRLPDGTYDIDRAANDLGSYPPIAARIEELRAEKAKAEGDG